MFEDHGRMGALQSEAHGNVCLYFHRSRAISCTKDA